MTSPFTLGIFVRHPLPGRVKTRLAADIGPDRAAQLYAASVADVVARFRDTGTARCLACEPDTPAAADYFRALGGAAYQLWPQSAGDLGARLAAFFDQHLPLTPRVIVIGSDSPTLPREFVPRAAELLNDRDCVLGPAADGGYYLIGLRRACPDVFRDIDWGTSRVLAQTVDRLATAGLTLHLLPLWTDIDTLDDLHALRGHLAALRLAGLDESLPHTEARLRDVLIPAMPPGDA
jgi:rSAM/selenodomain-associated transferase 1